ncbi:MAG: efflux RND transporter permease subunit [Xanthomonadales bacterium]|nr:efflux RND transporter permease subunit [Xanthomonadales bacterium]
MKNHLKCSDSAWSAIHAVWICDDENCLASFAQPVIVFASIPLALSGAILALLMFGYSFSVMAFIGLASLMGIIVNNSIILVDTANQLVRKGEGIHAAIISAVSANSNYFNHPHNHWRVAATNHEEQQPVDPLGFGDYWWNADLNRGYPVYCASVVFVDKWSYTGQ